MRKIVNGKLYDTETAKLLHEWDNGYSRVGDFKARGDKLYRTRKGAFFLYHWGGPESDMGTPCGGGACRCGSEDIEPVTREEAILFLEAHDGFDVLLKEFPDAVEEA